VGIEPGPKIFNEQFLSSLKHDLSWIRLPSYSSKKLRYFNTNGIGKMESKFQNFE
jgi:hypothetical protein